MKLGILETGQLPDELAARYGEYPGMFADLLRPSAPEMEFAVYHVVDQQIPRTVDECDGWLITGSRHGVYEPLPWIEPLKGFLQNAYRAGVPIVGICFGHQILAEALGGQARKSEQGWGIGVQRYRVHHKPTWLTDVEDEMVLNAMHQDQVIHRPADAEVVASSEFCPNAVLAYRGNAISFQPHPEFGVEFLRELIEDRRGAVFNDAVADAGVASLNAPVNNRQAGDWIVNFLQERFAKRRKAS